MFSIDGPTSSDKPLIQEIASALFFGGVSEYADAKAAYDTRELESHPHVGW
jgi:hypothetical protein